MTTSFHIPNGNETCSIEAGKKHI
uniref:Uncharacterized protein n=1 Tax=Arundo donax TaxID=35708 RepID=A0A0A9D7S4_ARUDO